MLDRGRGRTAGDLTSLLVELMRALRGLRFYGSEHPARRALLDRSFLAWQVDLERAGTLELRIENAVFRGSGVSEPVPHGQLTDLAQTLIARGVDCLTFSPQLERAAFHAFVELLALNLDALRNRGGFAAALADRCEAGIRVDGGPPPERAEVAFQELEGFDPDERETEPAPSEPLAAPAAPLRPPAPPPPDPSRAPSLGSALLGSSAPQVEAFESRSKERLEESPLDAAANDDADEALRLALRDLDQCREDAGYEQTAVEVVAQAVALSRLELGGASYRAMLVLSDHAVGLDGRSSTQVRLAQGALEELAQGPRLQGLIDRACDPDSSVSVRAAQLLLQLGGRVVSALLDRLGEENDPQRVAQLTGTVLALGERGTPVLVASIRQGAPERARLAVRLAGELQSANLVPTLVDVLRGDSPELAREAARALTHVGNPTAVEALIDVLSCSDEALRELAAHCLGTVGGPRAAEALLEFLDENISAGRTALARTVIRELAALESDAAIPKLASILERKSLFHRKDRRELKLAAIGALAVMPSGEAWRAIERATRSRDEEVATLARQALSQIRRR
ncbi:MAG: HEAT repeat domain-containing protein [Proteobacteria bacterium]|nr:HEAT repeat domain-containing protein [Pseudomonadota bacterium]